MPEQNGNKQASNNGQIQQRRRRRVPKLTEPSEGPITVKWLLFWATVFTLGLKVAVIPALEYPQPGWISTWVVMAIVVYLSALFYQGGSGACSWYSANPYSTWNYRPRTWTGYLAWILAIVVVILSIYIWIDKEGSEAPASAGLMDAITNGFSELVGWFQGDKATQESDESEEANQIPDASSSLHERSFEPDIEDLAKGAICKHAGFPPDCETVPGYQEYWDEVSQFTLSTHAAAYYRDNQTIQTQKCWDCGNLKTGQGRFRETCNPFLVTMRGKHPRTNVWQDSYSCMSPSQV